MRLGSLALLASVFSVGAAVSVPEGNRALKIYHVHTGEKQVIVFKRNGVYDKDGLRQLNYILRDWRKNRPTNMDPHEMDLLWQVYAATGSSEYIHVVCGYRSPETNSMLRNRSRGVAKHSQHMLGKAVDFFIPGVPLAKLREIGLRMQVGGVGYYPTSGSPFVHMDTGSVRMWPRMSRTQLARVFPNGKTLYLPADGGPLPGYAEALAAYKARKGAPAMMVASRDASDDEDDNNETVVLKPKASGGIAVAAYDGPLPTPRPARQMAAPVVADMSGEATGQFAPPDRVAAFFETAFNDSDTLIQSDEHAALEKKLAELEAEGNSEPVAPKRAVVAMKAESTKRASFRISASCSRPADRLRADRADRGRRHHRRDPTASRCRYDHRGAAQDQRRRPVHARGARLRLADGWRPGEAACRAHDGGHPPPAGEPGPSPGCRDRCRRGRSARCARSFGPRNLRPPAGRVPHHDQARHPGPAPVECLRLDP
ncbi:MAG: DUF882 domain-containing protein [Rhizobiales bacterium]|nr:DUF882 domain-containing protein [Hyphomicrobiales bacterium]